MEAYIRIFDITIYTYGIFNLLGIIMSFILIMCINKKEKIDKYNLIIIFLAVMLGYYFGAKIINMIENKNIIFNPSNGFTYTGGIVGGIILINILSKIFNYKFDSLLSVFIVIFPTLYFFPKIGCFINGCCSGILPIPIQIIESIIGLTLTVLIFILKMKNNIYISDLYFIIYGLIRFILDFFRTTRIIFIFGLTITQLICILLVLIGKISLYLRKRRGLYG